MKNKILSLLCMALLAVSGLSLSACTTTQVGGSDYTVGGAQQAYYVEYGTVQSVRAVNLHNNTSTGTGVGIGAVAGAVGGGLLGGLIGDSSTGVAVGAGLGTVAGGAAGGLIANNTGTQAGLEVSVRLDNGQQVAVVQGADIEFYPGQRVQVISGNNGTRVAPVY